MYKFIWKAESLPFFYVRKFYILIMPKMNIHKDKMLWYNTRYCIRVSMREAEI